MLISSLCLSPGTRLSESWPKQQDTRRQGCLPHSRLSLVQIHSLFILWPLFVCHQTLYQRVGLESTRNTRSMASLLSLAKGGLNNCSFFLLRNQEVKEWTWHQPLGSTVRVITWTVFTPCLWLWEVSSPWLWPIPIHPCSASRWWRLQRGLTRPFTQELGMLGLKRTKLGQTEGTSKRRLVGMRRTCGGKRKGTAHAWMHTQTHTDTHTHWYTHIDTLTHTHWYTHTHTLIPALKWCIQADHGWNHYSHSISAFI